MNSRTIAAAIAAGPLIAFALAACSSGDGDSKASAERTAPSVRTAVSTSPSTTSPRTSIALPEGYPPVPTGANRASFFIMLKAADPSLGKNQADAIAKARVQCRVLYGDGDDSGHRAAALYSTKSHPLTDHQGVIINTAILASMCLR